MALLILSMVCLCYSIKQMFNSKTEIISDLIHIEIDLIFSDTDVSTSNE